MSAIESRRIGGDFELVAADLAFSSPVSDSVPSFGAACESWLDCGRSSLGVIARQAIASGANARVWLPAYCCESVVQAFARQAFEVCYYGVGASLELVEAQPARGDVLLFIHYFGCRNQAALSQVASWQRRGVWIVEDCVQAGLTAGVGQHGDFAVSSLRKLLPQPDGALLGTRRPLTVPLLPSDEAFVSAKVAGKMLRGSRAPDETFLALFAWAESRLDALTPREMSWVSRCLLQHADLPQVARRRRANWSLLSKCLGSEGRLRGLAPLTTILQEGEVPLGLPVQAPRGQRDALRLHLSERKIYCAVHWHLDHLPEGGFAAERALSRSLLTLPVDQRMDEADVQRLVDALKSFPGELR